MINRDRATRQLIVDTAIATPGVACVLARRGQLLISKDIDSVDSVRVRSGDPARVELRIAIVEGEPAIRVLKQVEANLMKAVPTIDDKPVEWSITAASAKAEEPALKPIEDKKPAPAALEAGEPQPAKLEAGSDKPQLEAPAKKTATDGKQQTAANEKQQSATKGKQSSQRRPQKSNK